MGWTKWSYWLRGASIGASIGAIILISLLTYAYVVVFNIHINNPGEESMAGLSIPIFGLIGAAAFWMLFIIGAIIGLIYGKVKNR